MDLQSYWTAFTYPEMRLAAIKPHWLMAQQFLMERKYFIELGGYDCLSWDYQDASVKDLIFRAQHDGAEVIMAPKHCLLADHLPRRDSEITVLFITLKLITIHLFLMLCIQILIF